MTAPAPSELDRSTPPDDGPIDRALLAALLDEQREAVLTDDPVLCVLAGAGTGKTRVLTLRVGRRLQDRTAHPDHVLVCTFSRKAADELRQRLWTTGVGAGVRAGTFHRTALGLIRQHRADRGLPAPAVLADRQGLLAELLRDLRDLRGLGDKDYGSKRSGRSGGRRAQPMPLTAAQRQAVRRLETELTWAKARLVAPDRYEAATAEARRRPALGPARVAELYGRYELVKRRRGVLDLDDLLVVAGDLLEEDARFAAAVRWRFRQLFVDEMQDVNPAQFRLLRGIAGDDPDLFVVGDPHQSVYGWNGADPTLLDRLAETYPQARVIRLDRNHRCSPQVVGVAAAALGVEDATAPRSTRADGPLPRVVVHPTDVDEAAWVAREAWLSHRPGRRWSQIAVLSRTNAQLDLLADTLTAARIPCRVAGGDLAPASDVRTPAGVSRAGQAGQPGQAGHPGHDSDEEVGDGIDDGGTQPEASGAEPDDGDAVVLSTFHRAKGLQWQAVFVVGLSAGFVPLRTARTPAAMDEERRLLYVALTRAELELVCSWAHHPDARSAADGTPPRDPSPWLAAIQEAIARLGAEQAPVPPEQVATHLAELRRRLEGGPDHPTLGSLSR